MKRFYVALAVTVVAAVVGLASPAYANQDNPKAASSAANLSGLHDFDFFVGEWHAHHRKLKERLAGSHDWVEFDGNLSMRKLMGGWANEDESIFNVPGGVYRGVTLRAYDGVTGQWAIWWLDSRMPFAPLDPPVKGHFVNGVGVFYSDDTLGGKPVKVRFTWSNISPTTAHWEQAFSGDDGKTWETNWTTDFTRAP
ncbi:hypothetical protein GCM10007862_35060 [Dyella lipolytica]|uniref:DUF1579 domain-containing protein n=1 Tax=Dyella lipolytica TaxID=1867835 RepID=A0ABW8IX89_9GAMM|nr:hypothetical protein [Dyella lipolytica]GLQ48455.1 hypothetical protein GCM10007862_35060 [Dyella lipolytica]